MSDGKKREVTKRKEKPESELQGGGENGIMSQNYRIQYTNKTTQKNRRIRKWLITFSAVRKRQIAG